jgi:hypothetical protein
VFTRKEQSNIGFNTYFKKSGRSRPPLQLSSIAARPHAGHPGTRGLRRLAEGWRNRAAQAGAERSAAALAGIAAGEQFARARRRPDVDRAAYETAGDDDVVAVIEY